MRLALIDSWPDVAGEVVHDDRPSIDLVRDDDTTTELLKRWMEAIDADLHPADWTEAANDYGDGSTKLATVVPLNEAPVRQLVQLAASDEWEAVDSRLMEAFGGESTREQRRELWIDAVLRSNLAARPTTSWQVSWSGPAQLVDETGAALDTTAAATALAAGDMESAKRSIAALGPMR